MTKRTDGPAGGKGKWSVAGVPHRGWTCVNHEDLGSPSMQCEMCESSEIRYVHYMQHPGYPGTLACGCVCAGNMEEGLARAEGRERTMKSNARKRSYFPRRKGWYENRNGNPQIKIDGFRVTMFQKAAGWGGVVNHPLRPNGVFTREKFESLEAAQRAAFDTLTFLQDDLRG